ncbi:peptidoglycan-associated lipoprotein [Pedobacter sp. UYEF25]
MELQIQKLLIRFRSNILCSALLLTAIASANAQYVIKEADAQFALNNYHKAADLYEQAYKKQATLHSAQRAAESYSAQSNFKLAESWFAIASEMKGSPSSNVLEYAKALQNNGKYSEAKLQYLKYGSLNKDVSASQQRIWVAGCDSSVIWMRNPTDAKVINQKDLNSKKSEWGAVKQSGNIVFVSDREQVGDDKNKKGKPFLKFDGDKKPSTNIFGRTGNAYLSLYEKEEGKDSVIQFPLVDATAYHMGPASFTADGATVYYARSQSYQNLKLNNSANKENKSDSLIVQIFTATKGSNGKWEEPTSFKYNSAGGFSVGDPFISADGKTLYFSSNIPGGVGGMDLYVCNKNTSGDWGSPENLEELNSGGNDRSPSLTKDGSFYFSSDGRVGMGGLDVYKSIKTGNDFSAPVNMHYPINSSQDDFAFNMYSDTDGFLSSNRTDGIGSDDIYHLTIKKLLAFTLAGKVFDKSKNTPLANALVSLNKINGETLKFETDVTGDFKFKLDSASDYKLSGEKTGFRGDNSEITTKDLQASAKLEQNLYLEEIVINKPIKLENIYYDFNKSNIRPDAAIELDKLVKVMKDNPTIWIELGSHTDSRGSNPYNLKLSQRRADAAVKYIIGKGVNKNRIEAKGYGETQPVNKCINGVKCSAADYQLNRRTEFKITKQ